jgi:hypothetical protein
MRRLLSAFIVAGILLAGCHPLTPGVTPVTIPVQYSAATVPWLTGIYKCAGANVVTAEQRAVEFQDLQSVDLAIRIGQPDNLKNPAYQIGSEEILVIVNPKNPVKSLTAEQVRRIFNGQTLSWQGVGGSNTQVQVWVYSSGEDIQQIFESTVMDGSPVTSNARLATNPDEMALAIANDVNAVGILTQSLMGNNVSDAFLVATVPVLALTKSAPQGAVQTLIACLQNKVP